MYEQEIEKMISEFQIKIKAKFQEYLKDVRSEATIKKLKEFLDNGDVNGAIRYMEDKWNIFIPLFISLYYLAANTEKMSLFNLPFINMNSATLQATINTFKFNMISNDPIRTEFYRFLSEGKSYDEIISEFSQILGLNQNQLTAIKNYRKLLENGNKAAFSRILRNPSFDDLSGKILTENQIDRMVSAYTRNMIRFRAESIAQNETLNIIEAAREEAVIESGELVEKEWRSLRDDRVRDTHKQHIGLDGKKVIGIYGIFISPSGARLRRPRDPNAPLREIQGCRCFLLYRVING